MAFYSEAVLDSETSTLLKNTDFTVLTISGEEALVYTYDPINGYAPAPQPVMSDLNGNLQFGAEPGDYYLTRGGESTLIKVLGENIVNELTTRYLTSETPEFHSERNQGVEVRDVYAPITLLTTSETLGNYPPSQTFVYEGASDITLTFPSTCVPNAQFVVTQGGTGKITIGYTAPATRSNYSGHTKTAGPKATVFVCNVGLDSEAPEYRLSGQTA